MRGNLEPGGIYNSYDLETVNEKRQAVGLPPIESLKCGDAAKLDHCKNCQHNYLDKMCRKVLVCPHWQQCRVESVPQMRYRLIEVGEDEGG